MGISLTVEAVTSLFLYGTETPSSDIESRLRPDSITSLRGTVDVMSFMSSVGRFVNPLQSYIVQGFLDGSLDLLSIAAPDANGTKSLTFSQLVQAGMADKGDGNVSINQYTTGTGEDDWIPRAFVWGSTGFVLSETTLFIEDSASRRIQGGAMLPYDDDFDLTAGNDFAQLYNDLRLRDALDPYGIGRKVEFIFDANDKAAYASTKANDVYTAADLTTFQFVDFATRVLGYGTITSSIVDAILGDATLMDKIAQGAEYVVNGHNVVFGNGLPNQLDASSLRGTFSNSSLPNYYVGGDGIDTIDTSSATPGDIAFGGEGNDFIRVYGDYNSVFAGAGNDEVTIFGDWAFVQGGSGNDAVSVFGTRPLVETGDGDDTISVTGTGASILTGSGADKVTFDTVNTTHGQDWLSDASTSDSLWVGQDQLFGGTKTLARVTQYNDHGTDVYDHAYIAADENAAYQVNWELEQTFVSANNGSRLYIDGYTAGVAQLSIGQYENEATYSVGDLTGASFMTDSAGRTFYAGFGQVHLA